MKICDLAGEKTVGQNWLQEKEYFEFIVESDILLFALSAELFFEKNYKRRIEVINSLITTLNILYEKKGYQNNQMREPVGLLILKSDLLPKPFEHSNYMDLIDEFTKLGLKKAKNFKSFFVSSVGEVEKNSPPEKLKPDNVEEPLIWAIKHL